jgi:hypothetical protein
MRAYSAELAAWEQRALGQLRRWVGDDAATEEELRAYTRVVQLSTLASASPPHHLLAAPCFAKLLAPLQVCVDRTHQV